MSLHTDTLIQDRSLYIHLHYTRYRPSTEICLNHVSGEQGREEEDQPYVYTTILGLVGKTLVSTFDV